MAETSDQDRPRTTTRNRPDATTVDHVNAYLEGRITRAELIYRCHCADWDDEPLAVKIVHAEDYVREWTGDGTFDDVVRAILSNDPR